MKVLTVQATVQATAQAADQTTDPATPRAVRQARHAAAFRRGASLCAAATALLCALAPAARAAAEAAPAAPAAPAAASASYRAQALLHKAVLDYQKRKDLAFADFNQQHEYVDGELYVYVVSSVTGVLLASGGPSFALVNRNVAELQDATGKAFFREMLAKARISTTGTVEYLWLNRIDNKEEHKVAYFERVGDRILAVGYYQH